MFSYGNNYIDKAMNRRLLVPCQYLFMNTARVRSASDSPASKQIMAENMPAKKSTKDLPPKRMHIGSSLPKLKVQLAPSSPPPSVRSEKDPAHLAPPQQRRVRPEAQLSRGTRGGHRPPIFSGGKWRDIHRTTESESEEPQERLAARTKEEILLQHLRAALESRRPPSFQEPVPPSRLTVETGFEKTPDETELEKPTKPKTRSSRMAVSSVTRGSTSCIHIRICSRQGLSKAKDKLSSKLRKV